MTDAIARPTLRVPDNGVTTLHDVIVTMRDGARLVVISAIRLVTMILALTPSAPG
jgi:hypothetical protein